MPTSLFQTTMSLTPIPHLTRNRSVFAIIMDELSRIASMNVAKIHGTYNKREHGGFGKAHLQMKRSAALLVCNQLEVIHFSNVSATVNYHVDPTGIVDVRMIGGLVHGELPQLEILFHCHSSLAGTPVEKGPLHAVQIKLEDPVGLISK